MRVVRLYVEGKLATGGRLRLSGPAAVHARRVLRLGAGDAVTAFNGDGSDYPGTILGLHGSELEIEVQSRIAARPESPLAITLVQGVARGERMDLVIQKATELGVAAIQPVLTLRSVVKLDAAAAARKQAHWRGVVIAACEQCGRARLPEVAEPLALTQWLQHPPAPGLRRIQLALEGRESLTRVASGATAVELLIGPEGGLEATEQEDAERAGYLRALLGPRVLRSETAAITALAVLQASQGDL